MKRDLSIISVMRKILFLSLGLILFLRFVTSSPVFAQMPDLLRGALRTNVEASVGEYYLDLYGYIAPYASIVLTANGVFLRSTVADANGNFSFIGVLVTDGLSRLCFDAVDFARLGESVACIDIPPVHASTAIRDIFLPPTLGLSRTEIAEGASVTAYGYSMPGALVTLYLSNGKVLTTYADKTGYYYFTINGLKAGSYSLYTKAEFKNKESLKPSRTVQLKALSWWEQFIAFLKDLWNKFLKFLRDLALGPLWLVIPILILIIILLVKLIPGRFGFLRNPLRKKYPLHHKWWIGY
jgi:hypothetical protein